MVWHMENLLSVSCTEVVTKLLNIFVYIVWNIPSSSDISVFYRVCSNDKHWGHIIPFIELTFKLFSTSVYPSELFFVLEEKLHFYMFQTNKHCFTDQLQITFCLSLSVPKHAISPSIQMFRTFYIPNLIPVTTISLDLKILRPNSLHILHLLLN